MSDTSRSWSTSPTSHVPAAGAARARTSGWRAENITLTDRGATVHLRAPGSTARDGAEVGAGSSTGTSGRGAPRRSSGAVGWQPAEGGARQVARRGPCVLLLDEPTQGVDVHAKATIHGLARDAAAARRGRRHRVLRRHRAVRHLRPRAGHARRSRRRRGRRRPADARGSRGAAARGLVGLTRGRATERRWFSGRDPVRRTWRPRRRRAADANRDLGFLAPSNQQRCARPNRRRQGRAPPRPGPRRATPRPNRRPSAPAPRRTRRMCVARSRRGSWRSRRVAATHRFLAVEERDTEAPSRLAVDEHEHF